MTFNILVYGDLWTCFSWNLFISQLVGTDHATYNSTQKALGIDDFRKIPNGVNGNHVFCSMQFLNLCMVLSHYLGPIYAILLCNASLWQLVIFRYWGENAFGMGYNGRKLQWMLIPSKYSAWIRSYSRNCSFSQICIFMQESGQISATDYVRITSTEWYALWLFR